MCDDSDYWTLLQKNFKTIVTNHQYYNKMYQFLKKSEANALLYGCYGFPTDIFIDEVIKYKFGITTIYRQECTYNKDIIYFHNQYFLEIDLSNPSSCKKFANIGKFLTGIIKNKNISNRKHFIILKHIDVLNPDEFSIFRIILENFSNNVHFLCTTHKLDKIDVPVKSRFALIRMPLFQHSDIKSIFTKYLKIKLNPYLTKTKTRNIIKAIYIAYIESKNKELVTEDFCSLNYPPLKDFVNNLDKKTNNLDEIRKLSYQIFQYNISIPDILQDLLKIMPNNNKTSIVQSAAEIDHMLILTNRGREPIYIEAFLCSVFI